MNEAHVRRNSVSPDKSEAVEVGTQCAIAQDAKMAETLAQMNVSKDTIEKLEDVLSNNEDVKAKLMDLLAESGGSAVDKTESDSTDSLPDPELMVEFIPDIPRIGFRISELGKSLSPDADGDDKDR